MARRHATGGRSRPRSGGSIARNLRRSGKWKPPSFKGKRRGASAMSRAQRNAARRNARKGMSTRGFWRDRRSKTGQEIHEFVRYPAFPRGRG
jgi:hypothetical protein